MDISYFHKRLNSPEFIPPYGYRRDKCNWELVSYVNTLVACVLSDNHKGVDLFIGRAKWYIENNPPNNETSDYYALAESYFEYIKTNCESLKWPVTGTKPSLVADAALLYHPAPVELWG